MRRSRSFSNIPIRRSASQTAQERSTTKPSSILRVPGAVGGRLRRTGSTDRLACSTQLFKKSFGLGGGKKSLIATPCEASGSNRPSLRRTSSDTNLRTPINAVGRNKSPFRSATNDKKWVMDQHMKVCEFLRRFDEDIPDIKPPTLNAFVHVISLLLNEIDPTIKITQANYTEVVVNTLKLLHYPGRISASLLKTANTIHSWPHIIAIFAWLVDLILFINDHSRPPIAERGKYEQIQCIEDFLIQSYNKYNVCEFDWKSDSEDLKVKFGKILNIDHGKRIGLEQEICSLRNMVQEQNQQIAAEQSKMKQLQDEMERQESVIIDFEMNGKLREKEINEKLALYKTDRIHEKLEATRKKSKTLKDVIAKQPCTLLEKERMKIRIDELKHTMKLMKERMSAKQTLQKDIDMQLAEGRKKVETEVFRLNNSLMQLSVHEPKLKSLHIKKTNYMSKDFGAEIESLIRNTNNFKKEINKEKEHGQSCITKLKSKLAEIEQKCDIYNQRISKIQDDKDDTQKLIDKWQQEKLQMSKQHDEHVKKFQETLNILEQKNVEAEHLGNQLQAVKTKKAETHAKLIQYQKDSIDFMLQVRERTRKHILEMSEIRDRVIERFDVSLDQIEQAERKIAEDLHNLDDVSANKMDPLP